MPLSARAFDLLQTFRKPGCAVCHLTAESVHQYLKSLTYEYVNKLPTHEAVRAARGFCTVHGWYIIDRLPGNAFGVAVLYEGLIRNLLKDMGSVSEDGGRRQVSSAASALEARAECPACAHRATIEDHIIRNMVEHIDQDEFADGFRASSGLCLPHLRLVASYNAPPAARARVISIQQTIWASLQAELAEFIRLNDYRFADEDMGEVGDSWRRAVEAIGGHKALR